MPNLAGDNITGVNNYKKGYIENYNYYNLSERGDYNINDSWRAFGRISRYYTDDMAGNPTPARTTQLYVPTGTERGAWQIAGDTVWTVNAPHGGQFPRRLAQRYRRVRFAGARRRRLGHDLAEQQLVRTLYVRRHRRAAVLSASRTSAARVLAAAVSIGTSGRRARRSRESRAAARFALPEGRPGVPQELWRFLRFEHDQFRLQYRADRRRRSTTPTRSQRRSVWRPSCWGPRRPARR